jgi:GNAT-family acetyltransferase (TIGR03103 family)
MSMHSIAPDAGTVRPDPPSSPDPFADLNPYSRIIADEAVVRGISVQVVDAGRGEFVLTRGERSVHTIQSLSELTSAVAFRRCDDKRHTREILARAGLRIAPGRIASFDDGDFAFLRDQQELVVKPARGEAGAGITVGVVDPEGLEVALESARRVHPDVLLEKRCPGQDLRILVIDGEVVAASVRRPPFVTGDGVSTVRDLIKELSRRRAVETGGAAHLPIDAITRAAVAAGGHTLDSVLAIDETLEVRGTANVHTGGTIADVTDELHPTLLEVAVRAAHAIDIPVIGVDLMVPDLGAPDYVIIEGNEQPGLANHEPRPTAARFVDLLFPETRAS